MAAQPAFSQRKAPKNEKVKNIIILIGDGMGLGAASSWIIDNDFGMTCFDRAQFTGFCKTYSANNKVTDSAASGTALGTGNKTNNSMVGVLPDGTPVANMTELAKAKGLSTGIVVSSYVQDATPGGFMAHQKARGMRKEISQDIIDLRPDVVVGGGKKYFVEGKSKDGSRSLLDVAKETFNYVETPEEFLGTDEIPVLGLFSDASYPDAIERGTDYLVDAMTHAIDLLDDNKNGFFLMTEGSLIDHAEHANNAEQLAFEMEEFDKAVNAAFDYADTHKGTLVIVTADHETGGTAVVSTNKDFNKGEASTEVKFVTTGHTAALVPLYASGANAGQFSCVMDNTYFLKIMKALLIGE